MTSPARGALLARLRDRLGGSVVTDAASLETARSDKSGYRSASVPLAVVRATSVEQVQEVMRFATDHRVPVVPRGAGTGLAGAAIGSAGEVVLDLSAMTRILELNAPDELAVVEPGVLNADLTSAAEPLGLWFAPDPASKAISTIGGNIATGAGGLLCAKYGVTRESVLGMKVVLADGTLMSFGHRTVKGVAGLDLASLMIGSEGTLGVIVEATVKLVPLPVGGVSTIEAWFADARQAAAASAAITAARIRPAIMELLDARAVEWIGDFLGRPARGAGRACLVVQTDGALSASEAREALRIIHETGGEAESTDTREEGEYLLRFRRSFHSAMEARGRVLIEDVSVPRSAMPAMFDAITRIEAEYGIDIPTVAHAGGGNLHPNFVVAGGEIPERVWDAAGALFREALALGGTLTGEHGVGVLKRRWLGDEIGQAQLDLQRRVKGAVDPLGVLNPGKVY